MELLIILVVIFLLIRLVRFYIFKNSGYREKTGKGYFATFYDKGNKGEYNLYRELTSIFETDNVFVNIYLEMSNGKYTEIDLIAIGDSLVFIFEMKNYSGRIYGSINDYNWTQIFHKNAKYKLYNPLKQNKTHVNAVKRYLKVPGDLVKGLVVFGNKADLSYLKKGARDNVCKLIDVKREVEMEENAARYIINKETKQDFRAKFRLAENASDQIKREHLDYVKKRKT